MHHILLAATPNLMARLTGFMLLTIIIGIVLFTKPGHALLGHRWIGRGVLIGVALWTAALMHGANTSNTLVDQGALNPVRSALAGQSVGPSCATGTTPKTARAKASR